MVVLGHQQHAEALHACENESGRNFEVCEYFLEMEDTSRDGGRFRGHFGRKNLQVCAVFHFGSIVCWMMKPFSNRDGSYLVFPG